MATEHNLPPQPYKKFFGRQDSINKIIETLVEGGTFIASIDGVGGIGKTALAYYFCKEVLLPSNRFNFLIWLTAKETVFDPFSRDLKVKVIRSNFRGIEELIDTILSVTKFEELIDRPLEEKKSFVEDEILKSEKIFLVLDNLESITDDQFFDYIRQDFNKFAATNRFLKVLTTSRKRKKIADFPVEIEGLAVEDALKMLKYLAAEYNIKDILNATDHDNIRLIERVGYIPLGIEFIIGQMALGKSRRQIYDELQGYPSLKDAENESEKRKILSDIIMFSFKDMYETLTDEQQYVFKVITALVRNRTKNDIPISFELLMSITGYKKQELESYLENLIDNNLITITKDNEYVLSEMAINFVRQYYDDFGKIEDKIVEEKNKIANSDYKALPDNVELFLNKVRGLIDNNRYEEAETTLLNALDVISNADARIYFELAKVQKKLKNFYKAEDNFRIASELNPKDVNIWYEWIDMEYDYERYNIALNLTKKALEKTNNDVRLVIQRMGFLKRRGQVDLMREEVKKYLDIYDKEGRQVDYLELLRYWKTTEHNLFIETPIQPKYYFEAVEMLIEKIDNETGIELCREALEISDKIGKTDKKSSFESKLKNLERRAIKNIPLRVKNLNRLFNDKNYSAAKKEAIMILNFPYEDEEFEKYKDYLKNALRVLLQILASEKDYDRVKSTFEDYNLIGFKDKNCVEIYERAKKEKKINEKNEIIRKIMFNIQECEAKLRQLVMWSLGNKEEKLVELVKSKNKSEWIEHWQLTKNKALKNDVALIHYSDLSHLRSILSWVKSEITNNIQDNSKKNQIKELLNNTVVYLENYISKERNESFHSRLQLYEIEELNGFLVDTGRALETINKIMELIEC